MEKLCFLLSTPYSALELKVGSGLSINQLDICQAMMAITLNSRDVMATWVGVFVSNIDGKTIRELEVEADSEEDAIVRLDFYDYDETWQHYSFVDIRKKQRDAIAALLALLKTIRSKLFPFQPRKSAKLQRDW